MGDDVPKHTSSPDVERADCDRVSVRKLDRRPSRSLRWPARFCRERSFEIFVLAQTAVDGAGVSRAMSLEDQRDGAEVKAYVFATA